MRSPRQLDCGAPGILRWLAPWLIVAAGVRAFTVDLQGGMPGSEGAANSVFNPDGFLREGNLQQVRQVVDACDRHGIVVILGGYYQRQDQVLQNKSAVRAGVVNVAASSVSTTSTDNSTRLGPPPWGAEAGPAYSHRRNRAVAGGSSIGRKTSGRWPKWTRENWII